jgi:signal transduction histidine kinase
VIAPAGLRGRLMLGFVFAALLTLAVVLGVVLGPLRDRLRQQGIANLETPVISAQGEFEAKLADKEVRTGFESGIPSAVDPVTTVAFGLRERTDARVLVANSSVTVATPDFTSDCTRGTSSTPDTARCAPTITNGFVVDTDAGPTSREAALAAQRSMNQGIPVTIVNGDDVTIATPLTHGGDLAGALVVERRLTEVTTAVETVRNALLAASLVALAVAIAFAITLSRTLTRRLGRLRRAALRITEEGTDATMPRDTGRDEVGDLARMQEELRRQESARRSFVATASHELRTPLTMLQGTMELLEEDLRDGGDLADAQEQVANARRELLRLSALASELLDLSRLDAAVQLRSEPVELGELARAVAAEFGLRARDRDVEIEVAQPPGACWGRGDPDAVARVVRILLDNALRYAPAGEPIRVRAECDPEGAVIEVSDRGPGIPGEEEEHIFERFHRGRGAGAASGFGLGLAIGRELAERMSGSLRLASPVDGRGACFVLTLPTATAAGREQAVTTAS